MTERRAVDNALGELEGAGPRGPTAAQLRHCLRIVSQAIVPSPLPPGLSHDAIQAPQLTTLSEIHTW